MLSPTSKRGSESASTSSLKERCFLPLCSSSRYRQISSRCLCTASYSTTASQSSSCALAFCFIADKFSSTVPLPTASKTRLDAMSSQAQEKKCCVCGAPSTMRCSACSQAGTDLYFCSTEHQKLVSTFLLGRRRVWLRFVADQLRSFPGLVRPQAHVRTLESKLPCPARLDSERDSDPAVALVPADAPAAPSPRHFLLFCHDRRSDRQT